MMGLFLVLAVASSIFTPAGNEFGETVGKTGRRVPFEVVQTIQLEDGVGKVVLNSNFTKEKNNVKPTTADDIYTSVSQLLNTTADIIHSYGIYISPNLDTLTIVSDSTNDTSNVTIRVLMR